jgi:hypothetical protein
VSEYERKKFEELVLILVGFAFLAGLGLGLALNYGGAA